MHGLFVLNKEEICVITTKNPICILVCSVNAIWWDEVDPWLVDNIYLNPRFKKYFDERAKTATDGLYPTVTVRQIMWALKLKPIKRERWETVFDRKDI